MLKVWLHLAFVGIVCQSPHLSRCVCMAVGLAGSRSAPSRMTTRDIRVFAQETTTDDEPSKWQCDSAGRGTQGGVSSETRQMGYSSAPCRALILPLLLLLIVIPTATLRL